MEGFVKGDVLVLPFPFSDLSAVKRRPALVIAALDHDEVLLCQITSEVRIDDYSVLLKQSDFNQGKLNLTSIIRPNKLFTADKSIILYKVGKVKEQKIKEVEKELIKMVTK